MKISWLAFGHGRQNERARAQRLPLRAGRWSLPLVTVKELRW
ncbi:hypothetical protein [Kaistia algarum]|nr:hypothetical protein [Kaistia algarum]MCX5514360.1 hypothetical protein [Kaistia algarum]